MKKFIQSNFTIIVLIISLLSFLSHCSDSNKINKVFKENDSIRKEIITIKNTTYTKYQLDLRLKIEGLKAEKRMIQSTDRKMLDVQRQTEIDNEISRLETILKNEEVVK
jgi:hypothetical protein